MKKNEMKRICFFAIHIFYDGSCGGRIKKVERNNKNTLNHGKMSE
jgi:hypothetical protein